MWQLVFAFVMISIVLSTVFVALQSPAPTHSHDLNVISDWGQSVCSFVFAIELGAKLFAFGPSAYLLSIWDFIDGVLVWICVIDAFILMAEPDPSYRALRAFQDFLGTIRAFRVLRLLLIAKYWTALADLLKLGRKAASSLWALLLLLVIITYMASIVGIMLFGGKFHWDDPEKRSHFNDFWHACEWRPA